MQKEIRNISISRKIIFVILLSLCSVLFALRLSNKAAYAEGDEPFDLRSRIGFKSDSREFFIEENGGVITVRVYVNQVQSSDTPFTLTETRFGEEDSLFVFSSNYTLPSGNSYTDVTFNQIAQAESGTGVRLSDIYIHCDTLTVTVGDVEYYGEDESYDDDFLAVVLDKHGDTELVIEGLPHLLYENDEYISSKFVRSGVITSDANVYYRIKDYNPANTKELLFDNYNSLISFGANDRNKTFKLEFFDNEHLNLRESFELEIYSIQGVSKIFDLTQRRYLDESEEIIFNFAIMDDEPFSDKYLARVQYYQPGETNPIYQTNEGSLLLQNIFFDGLKNNFLPSFRLFYTVEPASTAIYGVDYVIGGNYVNGSNIGSIEVPGGGEQYFGNISINTIDDLIFNGTRTVIIKFFVNGRNDILLQPLNTVTIEINDNEHLPENNTINWTNLGSLNGCGWYENNVLTINNNFNTMDCFDIGIDTNYSGSAPLNIPVKFEDITAKNGIDYFQESVYVLLTYRPDIGYNKYGININIINDFYFSGTRRLKVTILEEGLTSGLLLVGEDQLFIDIVGKIEDGYNYIEYTQTEIDNIFSVGKNETLTFELKRLQTEPFSTYLDLTTSQLGSFIEETHIATGLFPYEVVWAQGETKKTITFNFMQRWDDSNSAAGIITCLDTNMESFNYLYGDNQNTSVPITLYQSNSIANYYFPGSDMLSLLRYEYLYSSNNGLKIPVTRELLSSTYANTEVNYHLTFDYHKIEQLILAGNAAEIGTQIDDLSGTLYFYGAETTKYITVSVPNTVNMAYGSKYVNIVLSEPGEGTYLLYNWDYDGKFSMAQIKITNDITPVFKFEDLTTATLEADGFETTIINSLEYETKKYDSFRVELVPYETDETPYLTNLHYSTDIYLYSGYDLSLVGVEVFGNGVKIQGMNTDPYTYNYTDKSGSHNITYNYAYVVNALVNKENPYVTFTLKYSEIDQAGLQFLSSSLLIVANNQYLMSGWQTYEKQLFLNACESDAEVNIQMSPASVVSGGETDIQVGDIVNITLTRSSDDPGASTMFFSSSAYGVKSFSSSQDGAYYYEPLDALVIFEPYEHTKTVAFITRDNRPQGLDWDFDAAVAIIRLYNYYDAFEVFGELSVNVQEDWPITLINADVTVLTNYVQIHKGIVDDYEGITVKLTFDKTYATDIEFSILGLDERIGNLTLVLPAGEVEITHTFTLNENAFYFSSEMLLVEMSANLITVFENAQLKLAVPDNLQVFVYSRMISSQKFYAADPNVLTIDEDDDEYISLDIIANRSEFPAYWQDVISYVRLGGTAIYGEDYIIKYDGKGNDNVFDVSTGIVVIWKLNEKSTLKIYPIDNDISQGVKTVELTVLDYNYGYEAHPQTFNITINDNEYFGDVDLIKSQNMTLGQSTITLFRENHTFSDLTLNYEIEEINGIYGVDYVILVMSGFDLAKSGVLTFYGNSSSIILYVNPLTVSGETSTFYFKISADSSALFSIKTHDVFVSIREIYDGGEFTVRTVSTDSELNKWAGNYGDYLLDYTKYYFLYSTGAKVKVTSKNFAGSIEDIYMDFNPGGLTYISASGRSGEYAVPSGISLSNWYDINGDGIKELIFVANLDTFFGGIEEIERIELCGVYAIDLVNGNYTLIFALDLDKASRHLDIYMDDLKGDGYPDAVVFSTTWSDSLLRKNGGNILYIIDNENGNFLVENVYDGNGVINGINMTLYSVAAFENYKGYDRTFIEVSYYSHTVGLRNAYGAVIELSAEENAHFIYCEGTNKEGIEGSNFILTVYNLTGATGTAKMVFSSDNAVYGRDYFPENLIFNFEQGEYSKNITLLTLNNNIPTDDSYIYFYLESDDFKVGTKSYDLYVRVIDSSVVNNSVAYTIHQGFDSFYTKSEYITGDSAVFSLYPLTINGIRSASFSNSIYDVRLSIRFGNYVWMDEDSDGLISVTGLQNIYLSLDNPCYIYIDVEFLYEGTNTAFSKKTFLANYNYFEINSENYNVDNNIQISETIYMGKLRIYAKSLIMIHDNETLGRFLLSFTNSIDNKTYTFYSNSSGVVDAKIDFGNVQGMFNYSYILTSLSIPIQPYSSGQITLRAYKDTIDFPVTVIDSVRQTLLRNVLIEVVGIDINFSYSGHSNAETGVFTIPALTPLKNYRITVNRDYKVNYFETYTAVFTPTVDDPNLSVSLEIRKDGVSLDMLSVVVIKRTNIEQSLQLIGRQQGYYGDNARIIRYLSGEEVQLSNFDRQLLNEYLKGAYLNAQYYYQSYIINGDIIFSSNYPGVYKSLVKDPEDITLISYRYNPDLNFGEIKTLLGREELSEDNSRYLCLSVTYDKYGIGDFKTDTVHFYSFTGAENCIIDIEIVSDVYLGGKKSVPLVSFGTGLGSFLLQPVQDLFASVETASVPANFAFLNGMSFMLGFADIDFAFDYDEENMTFSLYMGASKDLYESSHGMDYGDIGRPTLAQLRSAKAAGLGMGRGQAGFGVGLGGKMTFEYVDSEWQLVAGEIYFSVNASYNYTKYILLPVISVPAFFSATVSLEIETTIYFDWNAVEQYTEITGDLAIELALEIECGIGIKGFLSASVYGRAGIEVIIQLESGSTRLILYVEGGVRIQIVFWKYDYSFGRAEWITQSDGYVDRDDILRSLCLSNLSNITDYSGVAALYNSDGELLLGLALGDEGQVEDVLVSNVYEKSSPQIAELADGTKMIAWINYDLGRGQANAEVINYIYFDGDNWSEVAVADYTLTADLDFDIKVINENFNIICVEVNEELLDGSTISERLIKSDVSILVFDSISKIFTKTVMTNNLFNDRQALFDYESENGIALVYRSKNTNITDDMTINDFLCGENSDNKLYYSIYNSTTNNWGEFLLFQYDLPAVSTMSLKIVGGIAYIALEIDNDDNFDTTSDREILLLQYIFSTGQSRIIQITDNDVQDISPSFMEFEGKAFMAYRSVDNVMYWYENESYYVCTLPQNYTNFEMFANSEYAVMLFTMSVEGVSQVFASIMDVDSMVFSSPAQITFSNKPVRDPFLSFLNSEITIYYCADTYTLLSSDGDEYTFSVTSNIAKTNLTLFSELSIEVFTPDYSTMHPGDEFEFTVRIYNSGTVNVVSPWIKIYLGEALLEEFISGTVPGNGYLDVSVILTLPLERSILKFEVGKDGLIENPDNNFSEIEVLLFDISIDKDYKLTFNEDGTLTVNLSVTNEGAVDISNITINITAYSNISLVYSSMFITNLSTGEIKNIVLIITKENVHFNGNDELWLKAYALTAGRDIYTVKADDYDTSNNVRSLRTARALFANNSTLALLTEDMNLSVNSNGYISIIYTGDGTVTITSSDISVLTVNGRIITALKSGTAILTITDGTETKNLSITVNASETSTEPYNPVILEPELENTVQWWIYFITLTVIVLFTSASIIIIIMKKGKNKIKK